MKTNSMRGALVVALFFVLAPQTVSAKLNKKTKEELQGYATKFETISDVDGKVAWLLTRGRLVAKKERKTIEAFKTDEDETVRFAAGLSLYLSGDRGALKFMKTEFAGHGNRLRLLDNVVATLDAKQQKKLLNAFLKDSKPEVASDLFRYAIKANPDWVTKRLSARKKDKFHTQAWEAVSGATPKVTFAVIDKESTDKKNQDDRAAALSLAIAWADAPKWKPDALKRIRKIAKSDPSFVLKEKAARALVQHNAQGAGDLFVDAVWANPKPDGQESALAFLVQNGATVTGKKLEAVIAGKNPKMKRNAYVLTSRKNKKLGKSLEEMYRSIEFEDRLTGVRAIGVTKSPNAKKVLTSAIFEGDKKIRMAAAHALQDLADVETLGALKTALSNEKDPKIKFQIVKAIGSIKSEKALQILRFQTAGNDAKYKQAIIAAIKDIGLSKGAKALDVLIKDRNLETQWKAFLAMATLDIKEASRYYKAVFRNPVSSYLEDIDQLPPAIRKKIYTYLFISGGPSVKSTIVARGLKYNEFLPKVYKLVNSGELSERARLDIARHIFKNDKLGRPKVEKFVRTTLSNRLARQGMWMLSQNPSKSDEPTFRGLLGHKDKSVGAIAMYALSGIL